MDTTLASCPEACCVCMAAPLDALCISLKPDSNRACRLWYFAARLSVLHRHRAKVQVRRHASGTSVPCPLPQSPAALNSQMQKSFTVCDAAPSASERLPQRAFRSCMQRKRPGC